MKATTIHVTLHMINYIGHPYWPERETIITIQKDSGMARQKSDEKRALALNTQLKKVGLTPEDYEKLVALANRQWYRVDCLDEESEIIIPRHHLAGACVQTIGVSPKTLRGSYDKDNFRSLVQISNFTTGKTTTDTKFDRYVKRETGNMRAHEVNDVIQNFTAKGTLTMIGGEKPDVLKRLFEHTIEITGVGACRKMGYGRGEVTAWEIQ